MGIGGGVSTTFAYSAKLIFPLHGWFMYTMLDILSCQEERTGEETKHS